MKDYQEILSSEAGRRIFGGIFFATYQNTAGLLNDYQQGMRDSGLRIANTIREIDPRLIAECEISCKEFMRRFKNVNRDDGNDSDTAD